MEGFCIRAPTHIETTHKADSAVHNTQLLMMGPIEDTVAELSIDRSQGAGGGLCKVSRPVTLQRQSREARDNLLGVRCVIGMSEDLDILVETLEGVFRVLEVKRQFMFCRMPYASRVDICVKDITYCRITCPSTWLAGSHFFHAVWARTDTHRSKPQQPPCTQ